MKDNVTLHETFWFWLAIAAPLLASLLISIEIYSASEELSYSFKYTNVSNLLQAYKLPIGICGLTIPFVAIVAAIHRSSQAARQIQVQQEQNIFTNHLKHLEEFKLIFSDGHPKAWDSIEAFHKDIYPDTMHGFTGPKGPDSNPNSIISKILTETEEYPLRINEICTDKHSIFVQALVTQEIKNNQLDIGPMDILHLFDSIKKAHTFIALHPAPYHIDKDLRKKTIDLETLSSGLYKTSISIPSVLRVLTEYDTTNRSSGFSGENRIVPLVNELHKRQSKLFCISFCRNLDPMPKAK